jgi:hypothetical protein
MTGDDLILGWLVVSLVYEIAWDARLAMRNRGDWTGPCFATALEYKKASSIFQ